MNIYKPILGNLIDEFDITLRINECRQDGSVIENRKIYKFDEIDLNSEDVEFEKCVFKECRIKGSFEKAVFHDVVFEHCDFSNCVFREGSFIRVEINNCKMVGSDFSDSRFYHLSCIDSNFEYANFSNANFEETVFDKCDLTSGSFQECKVKHIYFENSELIETSFFRTYLKDIDLSTCHTSKLVVRIDDLEGAIVNSFQAIEFSKLLGLIIK